MEKWVLIVESDAKKREKIAVLVHRAASEINVKVKIWKAVNTIRAVKILKYNDIDLLILNTVYRGMPRGQNPGISLVEGLRKVDRYISLPVIFVSANSEMRKYAFRELDCLGFITNALDEERLEEKIQKGLYHTTRRDGERQFLMRTKNIMYLLRIKDIVYIEVGNRELLFGLEDGSVLQAPYRSLQNVKEKMHSRTLVQCDRKTMVNIEYIQKMDEKNIFLSINEKMIKMKYSLNYKNDLKAVLW